MKTDEREHGERFEALDSWRGICAVLVVVFHFIAAIESGLSQVAFLRNAYLFVDFFFVLSGFVLCHGYRGRLGNPQAAWQFAIKRFGRVWPLHAAVLVFFVAAVAGIGLVAHPERLSLTWASGDYAIDAIIPSALLLTSVGLQGSVWNGPAWSIGAEFYTYLLFALLVMVAPRRLLIGAAALSAGALAVIYWKAPTLMNATWDYGFVRCIAGFFGGVVAYHLYAGSGRWSLSRATLWEIGAVVAVILFVCRAGKDADNVYVLSLAAPGVFGAAVVIFARQQGAISLLLLAQPFRALGRYSYSIYMIHMPMLTLLCYGAWYGGYRTLEFNDGAARVPLDSVGLLMVDFVLAVIVLAAATHHFIEKPARARFNRLAQRVGARRTNAAAAAGLARGAA